MIEIYSFEEWDALQDPDKTVEWGSTTQETGSEAKYNSCAYKDAPLRVRKIYYSEYVHRATNPNIQP